MTTIAGLAAEGETTVDDTSYVERGYEDFDGKLRKLGADIEKVSDGWSAERARLKLVN